MTSKEMEIRSGVPRANIRYYEAEGLLSPARSGNGYRDYSEEDLRTLEKIKLLRRLGVTIEELRALRDGKADLAAVLDRRLAEVGGQRAALGRVERVCGDLRQTGATFAGLDPGKYLADLDAPALPGEGGPWWDKVAAPALPETDRLPTVCSASRRLFARMFDEFLLLQVLFVGMCLARYNADRANELAVGVGTTVLLGLLEALSLHLFGTTPGKALLGMRLTGPDGRKLSFGAGLLRYVRMLWHGLGVGIPIWTWFQMGRTVLRCWNGEPQPWDDGVAYIAKPFRGRYAASLILAVLLALTVGEAVNSWSQLPPNRGDLTVAEFAENYNRQAEYLGFGAGTYLDETGRWQEEPRDPNTVTLGELFEIEPWDEARELHFTLEDGHITAITLTGTIENVEEGVDTPNGLVPRIVMSLAWGREGASFWSLSRQAQLTELERQDWSKDFVIHQPGVVITSDIQQSGLSYHENSFYDWHAEQPENRLSFTYTVALDNG